MQRMWEDQCGGVRITRWFVFVAIKCPALHFWWCPYVRGGKLMKLCSVVSCRGGGGDLQNIYITGVEGGIVVRGGEQHTVFTLHVKMGDTGGDRHIVHITSEQGRKRWRSTLCLHTIKGKTGIL